eukprot:bmy_10278T0
MMALWSLKKPDVVLISLLEVAPCSGGLPADLPTSKYFVSHGNFEKNFFLGTPPAADGRDQGFRGPCQGVLQFPIVLANSLRWASIAPVGLGSTPSKQEVSRPVRTLLRREQEGFCNWACPAALPAAPHASCRTAQRLRGSAADKTKGLVLGICGKEKEDDVPQFTSAGENFNKLVSGKLREILNVSGPPLKAGKTQTFYGLHEDFSRMVVVGLGKKMAGVDEQENWHKGKENIRAAAAAGCRQVQDPEIPSVETRIRKERCLGSMSMTI